MTGNTSNNNSILGATTAAGLASSLFDDWKSCLLGMSLIFLLGILLILIWKRRKQQEENMEKPKETAKPKKTKK